MQIVGLHYISSSLITGIYQAKKEVMQIIGLHYISSSLITGIYQAKK